MSLLAVSPRAISRFWDRVEKRSDGCWQWLGNINGGGYGTFMADGTEYRVHRFAYMALVGPIPEGLVLDHLCRNRPCVNPAHLEPVTSAENTLRGLSPIAKNAQKSHCIHGHLLAGDNLILRTGRGDVRRQCRACDIAQKRRYNAKKRAARSLEGAGRLENMNPLREDHVR